MLVTGVEEQSPVPAIPLHHEGLKGNHNGNSEQGNVRRTNAHLRSKLARSEEHTSELQSLMRISYAVFCLKKKKQLQKQTENTQDYKPQTTQISKHISYR